MKRLKRFFESEKERISVLCARKSESRRIQKYLATEIDFAGPRRDHNSYARVCSGTKPLRGKGDAMGWRQVSSNQNNPIDPWIEQELRLLEQARSGSERAFSALVARYQNPVFRLIYHLVGDEDEARDLAYVALRNAFRHTPRIPAGYSIRPWIMRIASLVALDALRDRKNTAREYMNALQLEAPKEQVVIVDSDPEATKEMPLRSIAAAGNKNADIWEMLPVDIERNLIRRLISELPEYDAELLSLGVIGDTSTRDLAAMYNTTQRNIRRRMARALIVFHRFYQSVRYDTQLPGAEDVPQIQEHAVSSSITTPLEFARKGFSDAKDAISKGVRSLRENLNAPDLQKIAQSITSAFAISAITPIDPEISEEPDPAFMDGDEQEPASGNVSASQGDDTQPNPQNLHAEAPQNDQTGIRIPQEDISAAATVIQPPQTAPDSGIKQESSGFSTLIRKLTKPLSSSQNDETIILPQMENSAQPTNLNADTVPDAATVARKLPRFGPPSEEVIPFNVVAQDEDGAKLAQDSSVAETLQSSPIPQADVQEAFAAFSADVAPTVTISSYSHDILKTEIQPDTLTSAAIEEATAPEDSAAIEEATAPEDSAAIEEATAREASAAIEATTAREDSAAIEATTAPESNAAIEDATAPESSAAIEATTAPEKDAALEATTAPEDSAAIEDATAPEKDASTHVNGDNGDLAFLQRADFASVDIESEEFNPSVSSTQVRRFGFDPSDEDEKFTTLPQGMDLADLRHTVEQLRNSESMQKKIDTKLNGSGKDSNGKDLQ